MKYSEAPQHSADYEKLVVHVYRSRRFLQTRLCSSYALLSSDRRSSYPLPQFSVFFSLNRPDLLLFSSVMRLSDKLSCYWFLPGSL